MSTATRRNTAQRKIIMDTIQNFDAHPTAEELFCEIVKGHPIVGKSTVYRNLRQLSDDNIVAQFTVGGVVRYDKRTCRHYHFVCELCSKIFDIELDGSESFNDAILNKYGLNVKRHEIEFFGTCFGCSSSDTI